MWLINTETLTLKLEHFQEAQSRDYAILSHTWEDEEVTHREMHSGIAVGKKGYAKVTACCQQAARGHLKYAWVDTCW